MLCEYNTNYECRYHRDDVFLETDLVTEEEKEYVRDTLYREDMLNIFGFKDDDLFEKFEMLIADLYQCVFAHDGLRECMRLAATRLISEDEQLGFCILFSYDFMHLTHECICSCLHHGEVKDELLAKLRHKIKGEI